MPLPRPAQSSKEKENAWPGASARRCLARDPSRAWEPEAWILLGLLAMNSLFLGQHRPLPEGMAPQIDLTITDDFPLAQAMVIISAVPKEFAAVTE